MRLGILIRDGEYRNALIEKLTYYDKDLFVNIIGRSKGDAADCIILTDIRPEEFEKDILSKISCRTVFLSASPVTENERCDDLRSVFKYGGVTTLLSELMIADNEWRGNVGIRSYTGRIIAVCSESDVCSSEKASALARQIVYRQGGRVLLISLGYINDYGRNEDDRINRFARLMYMMRTGRESASESFTYTDSYGVSYLMLPSGINPVAFLNEDEIKGVVRALSGRFDSLVLDTGTCFREVNMALMKESDDIVCFETGRRFPGLAGVISGKAEKEVTTIKMTGETDEALAIDDCIRKIYGKETTWERQEQEQ